MTDKLLQIIGKHCKLAKRDAGEFSSMKVGPMKFSVSGYDAGGFGYVSVMEARGLFGLMKMDTVIIGPREKDAPLLSYDYIDAMGKQTLVLELYNCVIDGCPMPELDGFREELEDMEDYVPGSSWYEHLLLPQTLRKKGGKKDAARFADAAERYLETYMEKAGSAPSCDPAEKNQKISEYVEGLLSNGGPAVNQFLKAFGPEKTGEFLRKVLFGTED